MQLSAAGSALARSSAACRRCPVPVLAAPRSLSVAFVLGVSCRRSPVNRSSRRAACIVASSANAQQREEQPQASPSGRDLEQASGLGPIVSSAAKVLGLAGVLMFAALSGPTRAAHARDRVTTAPAPAAAVVVDHSASSRTARNPIFPDVAAAAAAAAAPAAPAASASTSAAPDLNASTSAATGSRTGNPMEDAYVAYLERLAADTLASNPHLANQPEVLARLVRARALGTPLSFDELMRSAVPAPEDVPTRNSREEVAEQIHAILNQYDRDDFDLGIKQFMMEAKVKAKLEAASRGTSRERGAPKDYEEALAAELFKDDSGATKEKVKTEDMVDDAFTTEVVEEALALFGDANSVRTAWRTEDVLRELSYSQLWALVGEGHVARLHFFGPERKKVLAFTKPTAPGGERVCKVVLPPDPDLLDHLLSHGVAVNLGMPEQDRLRASLLVQMLRYTVPFMVISALFWMLHTWLLDPVPNQFRRQEFIRYRREMLHVASKLNFRTPAREVRIDTASPDFIKWDDINGIDEVKGEINEIIEYLRNPALLRSRGVARIGGVLLAGAPGTGKTLLAKAIAAEGNVRMFTCSGTDFYDVYSGVGARRVRETFDRVRNAAPAILFIDEFDALGAARGAQASGDESASIINELLVQMDGFEDNRGVVLLGATNRPAAIDSALIRPGRFDRIIYMPYPDAAGRAKIMQVHARNKSVDPSINWYEVARAMAGFTGADVMGLMARAARMAGRKGREAITEDDIYAAMEDKAVEATIELTGGNGLVAGEGTEGSPDPIPLTLRKSVSVYEAGKAMLAYITPEYEEIARVSVCPNDMISGYTLFVEDEQKTVGTILTRSELEGRMVVHLAGRCAEKLVMGEGEMTGMGAPDLFHANIIAREMIMTLGMGRRTGPLDLLRVVASADQVNDSLRAGPEAAQEDPYYYHASDMSTEQARVALAEVVELLDSAEAKAMYGLAVNWKPLQALVQALLDRGTLPGKEVAHILETNGVIHFPDPYISGFGWDQDGSLKYPFKPELPSPEAAAAAAAAAAATGGEASGGAAATDKPKLTGALAKTWFAGTEHDAPRTPDGKFAYGWHWNMPFSVKKDLPDWYKKEMERYSY